ncbi:hypothetical protein FJ930_13720 [Mesorhizobium sp. B2-4-15]|uniref:hypothetical protein n=1 Tax=Mesorhizobium sp. B2-4-15 TaxID=2589934 RepID=UPI00114F5144|nr:hypothetical protein [Mesorhizobium sp. B2-4-15]TPK72201.1 hypothetical protein FJ930_13720 [Mesorhizobium sp. B2-4-15]
MNWQPMSRTEQSGTLPYEPTSTAIKKANKPSGSSGENSPWRNTLNTAAAMTLRSRPTGFGPISVIPIAGLWAFLRAIYRFSERRLPICPALSKFVKGCSDAKSTLRPRRSLAIFAICQPSHDGEPNSQIYDSREIGEEVAGSIFEYGVGGGARHPVQASHIGGVDG